MDVYMIYIELNALDFSATQKELLYPTALPG